MQRVNLLIRIRQALISMFLASVAALFLSTAPAYAAEADAPASQPAADNAALVEGAPSQDAQEAQDVQDEASEPAQAEIAAVATAEAVEPAQEPASEPAAPATSAEEALVQEADGAQTPVEAAASVFAITESGEYTLSGQGSTAVSISGQIEVILNLVNAEIDATGTGNSAISITDGAKALLNIIGANKLTGDLNRAGIEVAPDSQVSIQGVGDDASLVAIGSAGDNAGSGAGIGGRSGAGSNGAISIDNLSSLTAKGYGVHAAGIGSALNGSNVGGIRISNTVFDGVQGGHTPIENDATTHFDGSSEGGAGIGGGGKSGSAGSIELVNCATAEGTAIVGGGKAAGIGGSCWAGNGTIVIDGSSLNVVGGETGAGIGAGRIHENSDFDIVIRNGSTIFAQGGLQGAGIGTGMNNKNFGKSGDSSSLAKVAVTIQDSTVTAVGGKSSAGIGGGYKGFNVDVTIERSKVTAIAGLPESGSKVDLTVSGTESAVGQAGAAGIGAGAMGSIAFPMAHGKLVIDAASDVQAFSSGDRMAIDGFAEYDVAGAILQMRFTRNYGSISYYEPFSEDEGYRFLNAKDGSTILVGNVSVATPSGDGFDAGYSGTGNLGYYSFAVTLPEAGTYAIQNTSTEADFDRNVLVAPDASDFQRWASFLPEGGSLEDASADYVVVIGLNTFDMVAFREGVNPTYVPDPEPEPEPAPVPGPEPDPEPTPGPTPDPDPVPPAPTPDPTPTPDPVPVDEAPAPGADPVAEPIPDAPTPAAAAPAPVAAAVAPAVAVAVESIADGAVPLAAAAVEAIADDENPLAAFDPDHGQDCWVHWWILLGMILTTVYSSVVIARRKHHSSKLQGIDNDVMDGTIGQEDAAPSPAPTLGAQPAMSASAAEK